MSCTKNLYIRNYKKSRVQFSNYKVFINNLDLGFVNLNRIFLNTRISLFLNTDSKLDTKSWTDYYSTKKVIIYDGLFFGFIW